MGSTMQAVPCLRIHRGQDRYESEGSNLGDRPSSRTHRNGGHTVVLFAEVNVLREANSL